MKIETKTLKKYLDFLQDVKREIENSNGTFLNKTYQVICNAHSVPYSSFTIAKNLKFFTEINKGLYKVNINNFEPIHARKLIELKRLEHRIACKKSRDKTKQITIIKKSIKSNPIEVIKPKAKPQKKRQISILWGLIKFNY